jgi:putative Mg2+ transporter-C (MgtC) family protein
MLGDLQPYWSSAFLAANGFIALNLLGALLLGMLVGYERSFNGRAAGMRTYGLVCMASTALTVFVGHAAFWYGGTAGTVSADPTRVIQGVVTGIGFLGAGVIMKDGLSISGLTTAASIWAASAVACSSAWASMLPRCDGTAVHDVDVDVQRLEARLPGRATQAVPHLQCRRPSRFESWLHRLIARHRVQRDSLRINFTDSLPMWRFCGGADRARAASPDSLARDMATADGVASFSIAPAWN